jgi:hypothetical protein
MPFTTVQFTTVDAITFLRGLSPQLASVPFHAGPYIVDTPDQIVTVTPTSAAPGLALDGIADDKTFQVRCRGEDSDPASAEALALFIDDAVLRADIPTAVGTKWLFTVYRVGQPPTPLSATPDNGDRWEYIANYLFRVATDI